MKIGEFAKACGVTVSALRYYDDIGLLKPIYIDRFTGYRYYSESQAAVFKCISELKAADFSLSEIKQLVGGASEEEINSIFDSKEKRLNEILRGIDALRNSILGGNFMATEIKIMREDVHIPFENDERVIGRWEIIGEYNDRAEFELGNKLPDDNSGGKKRELYFLPDGEWYWCYSWTKGKLLFENGESSFANDYTLEKQSDGLYMFVKFKSYDYLQSGRTTLLVLKQCDDRRYTAEEISRRDDIAMPFVNDDAILGKWRAVAFVYSKNDFSPHGIDEKFEPFWKEVEFLPEGECVSTYRNETVSGRDMQEWTKGYLLRKWNSSACAYDIRTFGDKEYLFIEWKSGDYRWGGYDTDYYVFIRESVLP